MFKLPLNRFPDGAYDDVLKSETSIETVLGPMSIEARVDRGSIFTDDQCSHLVEFVHSVSNQQNEMLDVVYSYYKLMDMEDELQGGPSGLNPLDLVDFLSGQFICVAQPLIEDGDYDCFVYIRPAWDEEH